jgi:hypothetical protein
MHAPSYYREQAEHARRMARLMHQPDVTETLLRMAQDFEDVAYDLETGAVDVRHPELLPQRSGDGSALSTRLPLTPKDLA